MEKESLTQLKGPFRTRGGAKVPHRKNTQDFQSVELPCPQQVILPMVQHIGAPSKPVVKAGAVVAVGDLIAESGGFVSAPIHASVSGKVKKIDKIRLFNGQMGDAVIIESDGEMRISEN